MKRHPARFRLMMTVFMMMVAACCLFACNKTPEKTPEDTTPPAHTHAFTQQTATEEYLAAPATCLTSAEYYWSCTCGEKGTETFSYGDTLEAELEKYFIYEITYYIDHEEICVTGLTEEGKQAAWLVVPEGVTSINSRAFFSEDFCRVRSVTLPASLKKLAYDAFSECIWLVEIINNGADLNKKNDRIRHRA